MDAATLRSLDPGPALAALADRDPASLAWTPHADVWLLVTALVGGYLYALSAWGAKARPGRRPATRGQRLCFFAGAAVLWIAADWPIHPLAEGYLYSVHMVQHLLFQLVAAPLLILGVPAWLWRRLFAPRPVAAFVRMITQPLPAIAAVGGFTAFMHWPTVVNTVAQGGLLHLGAHIALIFFSFIMWWPVLSPLPELPHLSYLGRLAYLFAHSILPTVPASFLTFAREPLYSAYAQVPQLVSWIDPVTDLHLAGLIMKIIGGLYIWAVMAILFFRWHAEDETGAPDFLYWRDLEDDLEASTQPSPLN
jgi:putative membrane protein